MSDWLLSVLWYSSALAVLLGIVGLIRPSARLRLRTRRRAAAVILAALAWMALNIVVLPSRMSVSLPETRIDAYTPAYHFREVHTRIIDAPPHRVLAAIKGVTADEIALFRVFTSIRRLGRRGPEGILNAPAQLPLLDVATRGGFLWLADDGREVVVGSVVAAPRGFRPSRKPDARWFQELDGPGLVKATMNFFVEGDGAARTRVTTETRVFATDHDSLRRFTPYWRTIFPGSWILRVTWLRAIAARAEG